MGAISTCKRQRHRWFSGRMLACQFHWSSARAARVRFPADAAFLLERESQAFKPSGIHLWMAVNKGGKDNVFSMGGGRGRGGGEQTNRVISLHLSRKGGLKKKLLPGGESNPGLPRDRRRYSPLYYRGSQHVGQTEGSDCYTLQLLIEKKKAVPVRGIEPRPRR